MGGFCLSGLGFPLLNVANIMSEVMAKLQQAVDLVDEEEDFLVTIEEDLEASLKENCTSCFGKIMAVRETNIQHIRWCLHRAWRRQDFRVCKIGTCLYQIFFRKKEAVEFMLMNGLWHIEEQLLLLSPWTENRGWEGSSGWSLG